MAWLVIVISAAVLLHVDSEPEVLKEVKETEGLLDRDIKDQIIPGLKAIEPPEMEEKTDDIDPAMRVLSSDAQGRSEVWTAQAPPALLSTKSAAEPEEDRDHLYHPPDAALEEEAPRQIVVLHKEVISGPEEDRDHLYHG